MPPPAGIERILILRPSALGDVCRTVPVLVSLRRAYPDAQIDWLVQDDFAPAIAAHPALDGVLAFPRRRFAHWWRSFRGAAELIRWLSDLGHRRYDLAIDCQGLSRSGLMTWMTRARRRVGLRSARELAWLAYNVRHHPGAGRHTVDQMMSLLVGERIEPVYDLTLYVAVEDRDWWSTRRTALGLGGEPYAVLAPTSRWPSKRWPLESWRTLVRGLRARGLQGLVVIGAPSEIDQIRGLAPPEATGPEASLINLVGQTSIGQSMAIIAESDLVIANDSAPLHMAVGFDRPCIGLFGPTDPALVGPYGRAEAVLRGFQPKPNQRVNFKDPKLGDSLMRLIKPEAVLERVDALLDACADGVRRGPAAVAAEAGA